MLNIYYWLYLISEYRNGWQIRTTSKSFAVYAATSTEKQEWMAHINKCVEDLLKKSNNSKYQMSNISFNHYFVINIGGKKRVSKVAAVWVPDNEANICMHCKKTQFTMIVRRVRHINFLNILLTLNKNFFNISFLASLSKLWSCCLRSMFF